MPMHAPILMYHRVSAVPVAGLQAMTVTPAAFARHMRAIGEAGFTPVTVSRLVGMLLGRRGPAKPIAITFDDGFADFADHAAPILAELGFPATLYLAAGFIDRRSAWLAGAAGELPMLSWGAVREAVAAGVEIGGHTFTHPALDTLDVSRALGEIRHGKSVIEEKLGCPIRSFAYPFGYYDRRVRDLVGEVGFESACAVRYGLSGPNDDLFALRRYHVEEDFGVRELRAFSAGRTPAWPILYQRARSMAWGLARRGFGAMRGALT